MRHIYLRSAHRLMSTSLKKNNYVKIVEVGPRDGLQNEKTIVPQEIKLQFIKKLIEANVTNIEATAFVSPKWVPQMADQSEIMEACDQDLRSTGPSNLVFSALTPNLKGYENAVKTGCDEVAVFAAASQAFSQKNINCSIEESIERFTPVFQKAREDNKKVRGYVSCIAGCPYQGQVPIEDVVNVTKLLHEAGCYEISLGDTIGVGTSNRIREVVSCITNSGVPIEAIALHCHDTYGQAMSNCLAALEMGVRVFDGATSGLGGCPYAKGASGNVATEDLVYMLHGNGFETDIDLDKLSEAGHFISDFLERNNGSKVAVACRK